MVETEYTENTGHNISSYNTEEAESHVHNSEMIKNLKISSESILVSLDVLFTNNSGLRNAGTHPFEN